MANTSGVLNGDSRTADKFVVRLPDDMRARITSRARAQHRSMNSFIIRALQTALDSDGQSSIREEALAADLLEFRPQFVPGMACRFPDDNDQPTPGIIREFFFDENGHLWAEVLCGKGTEWKVSYNSLSPY